MSSPPAKRQRTEDAPITRSEIWYSDGSVVLQAQSQQFRVHFSVLAQNSSFFRDMQALPQPPNQPTVDGCPVIELQDSVEDVRRGELCSEARGYCKPLNESRYGYSLVHVTSIVLTHSIIRLGLKYDFRKLLDAAVERVMLECPTTLEGYDSNLPYTPKSIIGHNGFEHDMVTLVRENNILAALPCAYYRLIRYHTLNSIFDGVIRDDGTLASLTPIDQRQCSLSRNKIIATQNKPGYTLGWLCGWKPTKLCDDVSECTKKKEDLIRRCLTSLRVNALDKVTGFLLRDVFCDACTDEVEELVDAGREKMWDDLPSFFDLPPWNELKNDL
ncbi:BTB domain-containing protein [Mycena venus]|uniref:BTB domain-containing protein n=1 Tax=Mycena venus TaxID=2733690 RepID=A0A8H6YCJ6_9AGAR|nr:BTB domain-containing protein [Mycena venus]